MNRLALTLALLALPACSALQPKAPAGLTPQVTAKFYATYAIKDLDVVRDLAVDMDKTTPPMIPHQTMLDVVKWHQAVVKVIQASPDGWKTATSAALAELKAKLSPADYARFKPTLDAALTFIQEVQ